MSLEWMLLGFRILSAIILYVFLGLAFYIIWRDLKSAEAQIQAQPEIVHRLRVVAADGSFPVGETLPLQPVTLLGRDPENTIVINSALASARHACLSRASGVWWLEDLGSRNGTMLNELPLTKPTPLTNNDIIGIGDLRLRLEIVA